MSLGHLRMDAQTIMCVYWKNIYTLAGYVCAYGMIRHIYTVYISHERYMMLTRLNLINCLRLKSQIYEKMRNAH